MEEGNNPPSEKELREKEMVETALEVDSGGLEGAVKFENGYYLERLESAVKLRADSERLREFMVAHQGSKRARLSMDVIDSAEPEQSLQNPSPLDPVTHQASAMTIASKSEPQQGLDVDEELDSPGSPLPLLSGIQFFRFLGPCEYEDERELYYDEVEQHKGYVISSPFGDRIPDGIRPVDLEEFPEPEDSTVYEVAKFAVTEYNTLLPSEDADKHLSFVKLVAVNYQDLLGGILHYATIIARDLGGKEDKFYARVMLCYYDCKILFDFRPADDESGPPVYGVFDPVTFSETESEGYGTDSEEDEEEVECKTIPPQVECKTIRSTSTCCHLARQVIPKHRPGTFRYVKPFNPPPLD